MLERHHEADLRIERDLDSTAIYFKRNEQIATELSSSNVNNNNPLVQTHHRSIMKVEQILQRGQA